MPARGGSKGIPYKNRRLFLGRPLIEWTILSALHSAVCDRIVVSTDDQEVADIALACGAEVPFFRPEHLATDKATTLSVVSHTVDVLEIQEAYVASDIIILEPTSPGRTPEHISQAANLLLDPYIDSVVSVSKVPHHYVPDKQVKFCDNNRIVGVNGTHPREMIHRRQELKDCYAFNGIVFSCKSNTLKDDPPSLWGTNVAGFVTDPRMSVDLDEISQWVPAEHQLRDFLS